LAAFGQATLHFSDRFRGIAGFRFGREDVEMTRSSMLAPGVSGKFPSSSLAPLAADADDTYFSFRLGAQYDLARDVMGYATYTRGYKGPAINDQISSPVSGGMVVQLVVEPEVPHAWEAGIKSSLLNRRLILNAALFHTRTTDFQAQFYDLTRGGFVFSNAPELASKGFEVSLFGKPSHHLSVNAGVIMADAKYGDGFKVQCSQLQTAAQGCITDPANGAIKYDDAGGNRLPFSPKWKANLGGEYHREISGGIEGFVGADLTFTSRINFSSAYDPLASTGPHTIVGTRIGVRSVDGKWGASLWARNLFDERFPVFQLANPIVGVGSRADPQSYLQIFGNESFRTIGVSADLSF
jgi:iron complex outermembrane receptor protein